MPDDAAEQTADGSSTPEAASPYGPPAVPVAEPVEAPVAQYPPAQHPYAAQPYGYGAPSLPRGLSITSLVCGIAGAFFSIVSLGFGFFPALAGVIFGHIAQRQQPHARGMWLTGLITGYVGVGVAILWGIFFFVMTILPFVLAAPLLV